MTRCRRFNLINVEHGKMFSRWIKKLQGGNGSQNAIEFYAFQIISLLKIAIHSSWSFYIHVARWCSHCEHSMWTFCYHNHSSLRPQLISHWFKVNGDWNKRKHEHTLRIEIHHHVNRKISDAVGEKLRENSIWPIDSTLKQYKWNICDIYYLCVKVFIVFLFRFL